MRDLAMSKSRRDAVKKLMAGLAAAPFVNLLAAAATQAQSLSRVDEDRDPMAVALLYRHDAAVSMREDPKQECASCARIQADRGGWRPCELFKGRLVSATGWCVSWSSGLPGT